NLQCPAQVLARIVHFASRGAMDIEHLGERTAGELLDRGLVSTPADIFFLTPEKLAQLPNYKEKSIANLSAAIAAAKDRPIDLNLQCPAQVLARIVHFASRGAMDIEHLGERTAGELLDRGLVSTPADIFFLTPEKLAQLPNYKEKSIANLSAAIAAAKDRPID